MVATTGADRADGGRASWCADGAGVHHLATGNGDVNWEFLEPCRRKGQRIITKYDHIGQLTHLNTPECLLLEAGVSGVDPAKLQRLVIVSQIS